MKLIYPILKDTAKHQGLQSTHHDFKGKGITDIRGY
jgi:hypothetical protein